MLFPLLIAAAAGAGGYFAGKSKEEAEVKKMTEIAQNHRAAAAQARAEYEACSRRLSAYNPVLSPSFLDPASAMAGDAFDEASLMGECGEDWRNI